VLLRIFKTSASVAMLPIQSSALQRGFFVLVKLATAVPYLMSYLASKFRVISALYRGVLTKDGR
jgi:hypothetical protein